MFEPREEKPADVWQSSEPRGARFAPSSYSGASRQETIAREKLSLEGPHPPCHKQTKCPGDRFRPSPHIRPLFLAAQKARLAFPL